MSNSINPSLFNEGFVLVDLETTGFSSDPQVGIVEIAIIDHHGEILLHTLVNPERPIPAAASGVHGIMNDDVMTAPTFPQLYPQLTELLNGKNIVAYNHSFEIGIFRAVCNRYQLSEFDSQWYCAMRGYAAFRRRRKWVKLTEACRIEGIPIQNAHRALGDCTMTLQLSRLIAGLG